MSSFVLMTAQVGQAECFVICILGVNDFRALTNSTHPILLELISHQCSSVFKIMYSSHWAQRAALVSHLCLIMPLELWGSCLTGSFSVGTQEITQESHWHYLPLTARSLSLLMWRSLLLGLLAHTVVYGSLAIRVEFVQNDCKRL